MSNFRADQEVRQMRRAVRLASELEGQAKASFNVTVDMVFDIVFCDSNSAVQYPDKFLRLLPDVLQLAAAINKRAFRNRRDAFDVLDYGRSDYKKLVVKGLLAIVGMQTSRSMVADLSNCILAGMCNWGDCGDDRMIAWLVNDAYVTFTRRQLAPDSIRCNSYAGQPGRNMIA